MRTGTRTSLWMVCVEQPPCCVVVGTFFFLLFFCLTQILGVIPEFSRLFASAFRHAYVLFSGLVVLFSAFAGKCFSFGHVPTAAT